MTKEDDEFEMKESEYELEEEIETFMIKNIKEQLINNRKYNKF